MEVPPSYEGGKLRHAARLTPSPSIGETLAPPLDGVGVVRKADL